MGVAGLVGEDAGFAGAAAGLAAGAGFCAIGVAGLGACGAIGLTASTALGFPGPPDVEPMPLAARILFASASLLSFSCSFLLIPF